jgi:transaldolase
MPTKIFLDSADPQETQMALTALGFLDGQTTNPSLVAKTLTNKKFSKSELLEIYKNNILEIYKLIPKGAISIEVYADEQTLAEEMFSQAREFSTWIPEAYIKYPCVKEGLKAVEMSVKEGMNVNVTLVFSQAQAAAVYQASLGARPGQVFISPFVGRLDDIGVRGMDLIKNILKMYESGDGHVEVLCASIRNQAHILETLSLGCPLLTAPLKVLTEAKEPIINPSSTILTPRSVSNLQPIDFESLNLKQAWQAFDLSHSLTQKGLSKFAEDWNNLLDYGLNK